MILSPFFPYYGSCWSMAPRYPRPRFDRLIEPFAGSACYSLHHPERDVVLIERDPVIAELWRWLIRVTPEEVLALPDLEPGQSTAALRSQRCSGLGGVAAAGRHGLWIRRTKADPAVTTATAQSSSATRSWARGASYVAKASQAERNAGLGDEQNPHPTVKPVALMRWLCRLITPPGGLVIDPFLGSGSTGVAAVLEGFRFLGLEQDAEAVRVAKLRLHHCRPNADEVADVAPPRAKQGRLW